MIRSSQYEPEAALAAFLNALPKTETHLHLEGALAFYHVQQREPVRFSRPPASWEDGFRFRSFAHFEEELLDMVAAYHASPEAYYRSAKEIFARLLKEENVRYVECSFASGVIEFVGGDGAATAEAIKSAAPKEMDVRVFMGIHHSGYNERTVSWIDQSMHWPHLDGVDLHGPEDAPIDGEWTVDLWARFADAGKRLKAHAGEFCGPEFVRYVLDAMQVKRIQHGVRSIEDPSLVERLVEERIILDVCPISNLKLGVVPSLREHPIAELMEAGVLCTVSTDDPISFGNRLAHEYAALHRELHFDFARLGEVAANGFRSADIPDAEKQRWLAEIDSVVQRHLRGIS